LEKEKVKRKKRDQSEPNRRRYARLTPSAVPALKSVSFSRGAEVKVVDISSGGILLETEVRLRPQMKILLKLVTGEGILKVDGHVLRSSICSLEKVPLYKSAIAFDNPLEFIDKFAQSPAKQKSEGRKATDTLKMEGINGEEPSSQIGPGNSSSDDTTAVLTVTAQDGVSLQEMCDHNDW
jgi:hypothetical protein